MAKTTLKRLLAKAEVAALVREMCPQDAQVCVCDQDGKPLFGDPAVVESGHTVPLTEGNRIIATIKGGDRCETVATLLQYLVNTELERLALGRDTVEKYREIFRSYNLGTKLGSCLDTKEVAGIVTGEIRNLMGADVVAVLLCDDAGDITEIFADSGDRAEHLTMLPMAIREKTVGYLCVGNRKKTEHLAKDLKLLTTLARQAAKAFEKSQVYSRLKESFYSMVLALAETIEKRDTYTSDHTRRVVEYSLAIARRLGLPADMHTRLEMAAALHDIGKLGVREEVLMKPGPLNSEELAHMKMHSKFGEDILMHITALKDVIPGVKFHHERCDGCGYPDGLKGDKIDITARIISVADAFDAMTSDRPYRKALSLKAAFSELMKHSGTQFDPAVVKAFLSRPVQEKLGIGGHTVRRTGLQA